MAGQGRDPIRLIAPSSSMHQTLSKRHLSSALCTKVLQEKFRPMISHFAAVVHNSNRILHAAAIMDMPVFATEQYPKVLTAVADPRTFGTDPDGIRGSIPLTHRCGTGFCKFRQWPSRCQQKFFSKFFCLVLFEGTFTSFFKDKKS
jgi:hypothetical protein